MQFALQANTGLNPLLVACLKSIPLDSFSYRYKLRHPGAIYNLMTSKLIESIELLCRELKEQKTENIKSYFRLVLHDFFQFYETCYEIMVCFCKEHPLPKENEFLDRWLKRHKYDIEKTFYDCVKNEINDLRVLLNKLKHTSNDVRFIVFRNTAEITVGYYLEVAREAYTKPLDPISLNREIRRLYYLIYFVSEKLREALSTHLRNYYDIRLEPCSESIEDSAFIKLNKAVNSLSDFYLLNEIDKEVYVSSILNNSLQFTKQVVPEVLFDNYYNNGFNLSLTVSTDGYNNTFTVPTCGIIQIGVNFYYKTKDESLRQLKVI